MKHVYGKALDYIFTPQIDGERLTPYELVSARIYSTAPTEAQKTDSAAALGGFVGSAVTSWTSLGDDEYSIAFASLTDATPHSTEPYDNFYVVISFRFDLGGEVKFVDDIIRVYRPDAWASRVSVSYDDIVEMENRVENLKTEQQVDDFIRHSRERVFRKLKRLNIPLGSAYDLSELNDAVKYLTLYHIFREISGAESQFWLTKAQEYKADYEEVFASTPVSVKEETYPESADLVKHSSGYAAIVR
jgi:hypothetical protein